MYILLIIFQLFNFASAENNKPYEGYEEIVEKLSNYRTQRLSSQLSTSLPRERFHVMIGLANTSTKIVDYGMGSVSHTGFSLGLAIPVIEKELFFEMNGKFFQGVDDNLVTSNLQQFDAKMNLKESLEFAILNIGAGLSTRFLSARTLASETNYRIPSLMFTTGLERRVTPRVSLGGELGFHRSLKNDPNGKNTVELAFRLNYHL